MSIPANEPPTPEQAEIYIADNGQHCPYCGSDNIEYKDFGLINETRMGDYRENFEFKNDSEHIPSLNHDATGQYIKDQRCLDCGKKWISYYELVAVTGPGEWQ